MAEFGHIYGSDGSGSFIDAWGRGPFVIEVKGKQYRFEDSDRFGPALLREDGELKSNPWPGPRCPFWRAHWLWKHQGREVLSDGITCVWREPKPTLYRRVGRVHIIVQSGEPDMGDGVFVDMTDGEQGK